MTRKISQGSQMAVIMAVSTLIICVLYICVLTRPVNAEPLRRTTCADLREVGGKNCAMVFTTTVAKAKIPAPNPTQSKKTKTSLPAKAETEITAPVDTSAATVADEAAREELRPSHLAFAVTDEE